MVQRRCSPGSGAVFLHVSSGFALGVFFFPCVEMHHDPASTALHRRPAPAQLRTPHHRHLRRPSRLLRPTFRALAGGARRRRHARLPAALAPAPRVVEHVQPGRLCPALPVPHHPRPARRTPLHPLRQTAPDPAQRAQPRRGVAPARRRPPGARPRPAAGRLRLRPAPQRAAAPARHRHRQRPHGPSRPAGQGGQGPPRPLVPAPAAGAARLLAAGSASDLALPRPHRRRHPDQQQRAAPLQSPGQEGRPDQALLHAHAPAQLRDALARSRRGRADAQGPAGALQPADDRPLPARQHATSAPDAEPARPARAAAAGRRSGRAEGGGPDMTAALERPALEVADVLRAYGEAFLDRYGGGLSAAQRKALRDLAACRTAALGGHVERCLDCGHERVAYNSCRNRHCPKCQALARAHWLDGQAGHLLPVEYHHVVCTLPAEVGALALAHPTALYDLLLRSAAATLRDVAADPQRLGATVGMLLVLHTWGQNLHHHPHVHCVVTGGGLSCDRAGKVEAAPRWVACRPGFFLPVRVLSRVFRGKFLAGLRAAIDAGDVRLPAAPAGAAGWSSLYAKEWVVYSKRPFGGPQQVLKYLARYTHRVAISNARLLDLRDGRVTFRYQDYADARRQKAMTLDAVEFLRRFVQHVLPKGFVKIRHYGLLANAQREARLALCRRLLLVVAVAAALPPPAAVPLEPAQPRCCPNCGGSRLVCSELGPAEAGSASVGALPDSS